MINIMLCCLGGFSSSHIARVCQEKIEANGLSDKMSIEFQPFAGASESLADKMNEKTVVILCPHLRLEIQGFLKRSGDKLHVPVYVLPPRMYAVLEPEEILADCEDVIRMYNEGMPNPIHFPNEENVLKITRGVAYRNKG